MTDDLTPGRHEHRGRHERPGRHEQTVVIDGAGRICHTYSIWVTDEPQPMKPSPVEPDRKHP